MAKTTTGRGAELKSELHHWWPKSLSQYWTDEHGLISQISPDGTERRDRPKNFGAVTNAHHILVGGVWNSTFEPSFGPPDSEFPKLVEWVSGLEATAFAQESEFRSRITAQQASPADLHRLAVCMASMTSRSPRTRHIIKIGTEYYRERFGMSEPTAGPALIAANQRNLMEAHCKTFAGHGRWAVLVTDNVEFICGDGFLHNLNTDQNPSHSARCIFPLTPTHTLVFDAPRSYRSPPRLVSMRLTDEEVSTFNEIIQVYSAKELFYRTQRPTISAAFKLGGHRQYEYNCTEWMDWIIGALMQFPSDGPRYGSRFDDAPFGFVGGKLR